MADQDKNWDFRKALNVWESLLFTNMLQQAGGKESGNGLRLSQNQLETISKFSDSIGAS